MFSKKGIIIKDNMSNEKHNTKNTEKEKIIQVKFAGNQYPIKIEESELVDIELMEQIGFNIFQECYLRPHSLNSSDSTLYFERDTDYPHSGITKILSSFLDFSGVYNLVCLDCRLFNDMKCILSDEEISLLHDQFNAISNCSGEKTISDVDVVRYYRNSKELMEDQEFFLNSLDLFNKGVISIEDFIKYHSSELICSSTLV